MKKSISYSQIFALLLLITGVSGCGSAKTVYADSKYELCQSSCKLKHSKYDSAELSKCMAECARHKYEDAKSQ